MNKNVFKLLQNRGFVKQCSNMTGLVKTLDNEKIFYYVGFDPTADSLHVGSLVPIMAMAHLQRDGHIPICIIGGGTAMIGDPSGKTEMRRMLEKKDINRNGLEILSQIRKYLVIDSCKGIFMNNEEWLSQLNYIDFLRNFGKYFKVNEMIKSEGYRQRLERQEGLSFIEFNYQLLQAYDFLVLFDKYECILQMGGDDQWGNMLAGINLVKRILGKEVYALTFPLLTTARGNKMGKTETGTIWLDASKTSPYEFYQYWINVDDRDVIRFLNYFTFLSSEEIEDFKKLKGSEIRKAKEKLAFETTKITHGEENALNAQDSSRKIFSNAKCTNNQSMPTVKINLEKLENGITLVDLLCVINVSKTKSEARRLISQGGIYVNGKKISSPDVIIDKKFLDNFSILIRRGKKQYYRIIAEGES